MVGTKQAPEFRTIAIDAIEPNPHNARVTFEGIDELAASIGDVGLLQPPVVMQAGERFRLIAGERRLRAAKAAGQSEIVCAVRQFASEADSLVAMLAENLQRRDLNPIEKALGFAQLCAPVAEGGAGLSQAEAGRRFGLSRGRVNDLVQLLRLPEEWQCQVASGELCESKARKLFAHVDEPEFLAAVAADLAENPWAWATLADWRRSLDMLLASWQKPRPPRSIPRMAERTEAEAAAEPPARAEPAAAAAVDAVQICAYIELIGTLAELDRIQAALSRRRGQLLAQRPRPDAAAARVG